MADEYHYAGFILRSLAVALDGIILFLIGMSLLFIQMMLFPFSISPESIGLDFGLNSNTVGALLIAQFVVWMMYMIPVFWLYSAGLESSSIQGTIGKRALSIIVCDEQGHRLSFLRASLRFLGKILSVLPVFLGFFLIAVTKRKLGVDDLLAGTLVIHGPENDPRQEPVHAKKAGDQVRQEAARDSSLAWYLIGGCILAIFFGPVILSGIMMLSYHPSSSGSMSSGSSWENQTSACTGKNDAPFPEVKNWTLAVADLPFEERTDGAGLVEHNRKLWVAGGATNWKDFNDVWSSPDGIHWEQATPSAPFSPRASHGFLSYKDRLWVIGGISHKETGFYKKEEVCENDVWSSADGISWNLETPDTGFQPRCGFRTFVFNDKMWVVGGLRPDNVNSGPAVYADFWTSSDGKTWTPVTPTGDFNTPWILAMFVRNNSFWVYGISPEGFRQSGDGITWNLVPGKTNNLPVADIRQPVVFNNTIFYLETGKPGTPGSGPIWYSADGATWNRFCPEYSALSERGYWGVTHRTIFNNRIWIISDDELWHSGN